MISTSRGVTLTVVSGDTGEPTRTFIPGTATGPISVGADGDWEIDGTGVNARHLYLAFDGARLHVAAASPSSRVLLRGKIVEQDWRAIEIPSEVHFGTACIIVLAEGNASQGPESRAADDEARDDEARDDEASDDEAITVFRQGPLDTPDTDSPTGALAPPMSVDNSALTALATEMRRAPIEVVTQAHCSLESDAPTHCDNGALRELALQIASVEAAKAAAAKSTLEHRASTELPNRIPPACKRGAIATVDLSASPPTDAEVSNILKRLVSAWRLATRPQRTICALLPFALCAALWSPASGARTGATTVSPALARFSENAIGDPSATQTRKSPQPVERAIASSVTTSAVEATPVTPVSSVASRDQALPNPSDNPPMAARSLAIAPTAQRDALSAARTGKLSEAADLYQKLAAASQSEVFSKAALLARRQSVRTP